MKHNPGENKGLENLDIIDIIFQGLNPQSRNDIKDICKKFIEDTRGASERDFLLIGKIIKSKDAYINGIQSSKKDDVKLAEEFFSTIETLYNIFSIQTQNAVDKILGQNSIINQEKQELFTQSELELFINIFYRSFLEIGEKDRYILPNSEMLFVYIILKKIQFGAHISDNEIKTFSFLISRTLPGRDGFKRIISNVSTFSNGSSQEEKRLKLFFSDFINTNELYNGEKPKNQIDATKLEDFFADSDLFKKYKVNSKNLDTFSLVKDEKFLLIFMNFFEKNVLKMTNNDTFASNIAKLIGTVAEGQDLEPKILQGFSDTISKFIDNRLGNSTVMDDVIRSKNIDIYEFTKFDNSKLIEKAELRDQTIKELISNDFIIQVLTSFRELLLEQSKKKTSD